MRRVAKALVGGAALWLVAVGGNAVSIETLVQSGTPAVGLSGEVFRSFTSAVHNDQGYGGFVGSTGTRLNGVWQFDASGQLTLLAAQGESYPEIPGATFPYETFDLVGSPVPTDSGAILSWGKSSATNAQNLFSQDGTGLQIAVGYGDPVPGGGTIRSVDYGTWNRSGQLAYLARPRNGGTVLVAPGASGAPEVLTRSFTQAPGALPGDIIYQNAAGSLLRMNQSGQVAFETVLRRDHGTPSAIFLRGVFGPTLNSRVGLVALQSDLAPGTAGAVFNNSLSVSDFNDQGELIFRGQLEQGVGGVTAQNNDGQWLSDAQGNVSLLFREGDSLLSRPGSTLGRVLVEDLNNRGQLVGNARVVSASGQVLEAAFIGTTAGHLDIVFLENDVIPGLDPGLTFLASSQPFLSDDGVSIFDVIMTSDQGLLSSALLARLADGTIVPLLVEGQEVELAPNDIRTLQSWRLTDGLGLQRAFNERNELLVSAQFAGVSQAILRVSIPEPKLLMVLSLAALLRAGRRRPFRLRTEPRPRIAPK